MIDWEDIVSAHRPRVWRTVYRALANHADALDCYQETFLAAWRTEPGVPIEDWGAYLTTLAVRRAVDQLRARARRRSPAIALQDAPEPPAAAPTRPTRPRPGS